MPELRELRERKPTQKPPVPQKQEEEDKPKTKRDEGPDLEPNPWTLAVIFLLFSTIVGSFFYYKVDNRSPPGQFATWVNEQFPMIDKALNRPRTPAFGAYAQDVKGELKLTEEELKAYDGSDSEKPIYLAIDGTIFDVSVSPAFYGPGGHYNHFTGKDATRAWITECWDEPEQFTWRMDDVDVMFTPKWMDEMLEDAANGKFDGDMGGIGAMPQQMIGDMAKKTLERFGSVTDKMKIKRRKQDKEEALAKVKETLEHWKGFFSKNEKYKIVGTVIRDESRPAPPKPCEEAMKKRPMKGGKLEPMMNAGMGTMFGGGAQQGDGKTPGKGEMPAAVREKLEEAKRKAEAEKAGPAEDDGEDLVHEEL